MPKSNKVGDLQINRYLAFLGYYKANYKTKRINECTKYAGINNSVGSALASLGLAVRSGKRLLPLYDEVTRDFAEVLAYEARTAQSKKPERITKLREDILSNHPRGIFYRPRQEPKPENHAKTNSWAEPQKRIEFASVRNFDLKQIVFVKTDPQQQPHQITGKLERVGSLTYLLRCNGQELPYYGFELKTEPWSKD